MDMLKKFFPHAFKSDDLTKFIITLIIYVVGGAIAGALIWLAASILGALPVIGGLLAWAVGIIGSLIELYVFIGIVLSILVFVKVIK